MSWGMVKLDDCLERITYGFTNPMPDADCGPWKVTAKDIVDGRINFDSARHTTQKAYESDLTDKSRPIKDDILLTKDGTLGRVAIVGEEKVCINQSVALLRVKKDIVIPQYLCYLLQSSEYQGKMLADAGGSTIKHIYITKVNQMYIPLPPLEIQEKLVGVLQSYDRMLDNNQKQLKLLEEAAQRLYKEWFVDLRFPGCENTPIIDGVPKGWRKGILDDIVYESGKNEKKENRENYLYYLPIDCLPKHSIGYTETSDVCLAESSLVAFSKNDIVFGAMRPYFHKVIVARDSGLTRSTCFVLNARESEFWAYVAMLMFSKDTVDYATQISVGTTMPYARWKDLKQMQIIIPTSKIAEEFQINIRPIIDKIGALSKAIMELREARDCLLPKLMSGELEV